MSTLPEPIRRVVKEMRAFGGLQRDEQTMRWADTIEREWPSRAQPIYYEYECGTCTPSGCPTHEDKDAVVGLEVNGVPLVLYEYHSGDTIQREHMDRLKAWLVPASPEDASAQAGPFRMFPKLGTIVQGTGEALSVRERRVSAGLSLRETAAMMGLSPVLLGEVERGIHPFTPEDQIKFDAAIASAELAGAEDEPEEQDDDK